MEIVGGAYVSLAEAAEIERKIETLTPREAIGLIQALLDPSFDGNDMIAEPVREWAVGRLRERARQAEHSAPSVVFG